MLVFLNNKVLTTFVLFYIIISVVICVPTTTSSKSTHSIKNKQEDNKNDVLIINANNESAVDESSLVDTGDDDDDDGDADAGNDESTKLPIKYDGAQLWRIPFDNQEMRNAVVELQNNYDVSMWNTNGSYVDLFLKEPSLIGAGKLLDDANVPYSILMDNVQNAIETENPPKEEIEQLQNRQAKKFRNRNDDYNNDKNLLKAYTKNMILRLKGALLGYNSLDPPMELWPDANWGHRMTWSAYHPISDIYGYLEYLAKSYDDICSVNSIGETVEGLPIKVLRISNGNPSNRAIWLDGGIHAREWISPAAVTYIINHFTEDRDEQPDYIKNIDWYILPVANPDGYEYSQKYDRLWRKNRGGMGKGRCAGTDLNRNFGHKWGVQGASNDPCSEIFAGARPFSEPETQAQKNFFDQSAADFKAFLTFHSYGQYILYPWGYDKVLPADHRELLALGNQAAQKMSVHNQSKYKVGSSAILLYPAAGASDDWAKGDLGIKYTYTVELRDTGRYGFILPASQIEKTSLEALDFVKVIAQKVYYS